MRREDDGLGLGEFDLIFEAISETQLLRFVAPDGALRNAGGLAGDDGFVVEQRGERIDACLFAEQLHNGERSLDSATIWHIRRGDEDLTLHVDAVIPVDAEAAIDAAPREAAPGVTASEPTLAEIVAASLPRDALRLVELRQSAVVIDASPIESASPPLAGAVPAPEATEPVRPPLMTYARAYADQVAWQRRREPASAISDYDVFHDL